MEGKYERKYFSYYKDRFKYLKLISIFYKFQIAISYNLIAKFESTGTFCNKNISFISLTSLLASS